jgi:hypothetical protein
VGEHAIDYAHVAQKEKLSELQLRVRQLLDQVTPNLHITIVMRFLVDVLYREGVICSCCGSGRVANLTWIHIRLGV